MPSRCYEFVDSRLRRSPPDRASAVPYGQAGENAMRFPRLAHRSAAAHKLHSTPQQDGMNLISGNHQPVTGYRSLAYSSPEAVQTTGPSYTGVGIETQLHRIFFTPLALGLFLVLFFNFAFQCCLLSLLSPLFLGLG